ncbi:hypothetical protein HOY82DRAFT_384082 [Tuber indicum]|nr:hypothetical protein HOY82DRAFT_384082 [Tuber indicum]
MLANVVWLVWRHLAVIGGHTITTSLESLQLAKKLGGQRPGGRKWLHFLQENKAIVRIGVPRIILPFLSLLLACHALQASCVKREKMGETTMGDKRTRQYGQDKKAYSMIW